MEVLNVQLRKPMRFPIGFQRKKNLIYKDQMRSLFRGRTIVEEQMDGAPVKFVSTDSRFLVFAEDLRRRRSIYYNLPGRYAIFDIFNTERGVFICPDEKLELSEDIRKGKLRLGVSSSPARPDCFFPVPQIATGQFELKDIRQFLGVSAYAINGDGTRAKGEGIIVKTCADSYPAVYYTGKLVRTELENIHVHEVYSLLPYRENRISPDVAVRTGLLVTDWVPAPSRLALNPPTFS
jgi:hypothetical protein